MSGVSHTSGGLAEEEQVQLASSKEVYLLQQQLDSKKPYVKNKSVACLREEIKLVGSFWFKVISFAFTTRSVCTVYFMATRKTIAWIRWTFVGKVMQGTSCRYHTG